MEEYLLKIGWTPIEIKKYYFMLLSLNEVSLRELLTECSIKMFTADESIDSDQAHFVLLNPDDTKKEVLFKALDKFT